MQKGRDLEEIINEFYRVSWTLVDDLTITEIPDGDPH